MTEWVEYGMMEGNLMTGKMEMVIDRDSRKQWLEGQDRWRKREREMDRLRHQKAEKG